MSFLIRPSRRFPIGLFELSVGSVDPVIHSAQRLPTSCSALGSLLRNHEMAPDTVSPNLSDGTVGGYDNYKVEQTV